MAPLLLSLSALVVIGGVWYVASDFFYTHQCLDGVYTAIHKVTSLEDLDRIERDFKFLKSKQRCWLSHHKRPRTSNTSST